MVFNTVTVGAAVTPTVVKTYTSHYLNRKPRRQKPTAHISYDEGLSLIRQFLNYASHHTVEDIQAFTSQWVPTPRWVKADEEIIPEKIVSDAADKLNTQLGHKGIDRVGGSVWWQWRKDGSNLKAEWIEMRSDYTRRRKEGAESKRVMLYVHGGAYFFGSVDEHRYQLQRHARKLKARVFARPQQARRLVQDPSTIILAGDSAGGGMIVSLLVVLRDQGIPLPAGAILISPWVDLTHSFPSVAGDSEFDYLPEHGFLARPSAAWPPPNTDDMEQIALHAVEQVASHELPRKSSYRERREASETAVRGFSVDLHPKHLNPRANADNPAGTTGAGVRPGNTIPGSGHDLSIMIGREFITIKDQIQMYATNQLISHPLVSPILQPSLGGLPPLLILTGGGEMLRDEQIYLAHKAANPAKYPPGEAYLEEHPDAREIVDKWKPTDVQIQVWDDLCHVAPTLSFTRPAKFMFRSIAQFGAWALARAQKAEIEIMDDDDVSVVSTGSDTASEQSKDVGDGVAIGKVANDARVGRAGDPLPPFQKHMIRHRVDRHGAISPLGPPSSLPALQMSANEIGVIKPGPVQKWLTAKEEWDRKFAREKRRVQKQRAKEMAQGYQDFGMDDVPPPSALAGRRGLTMPKEKRTKRSWGMSLWSLWGSSHDKNALDREEKADKSPETKTAIQHDGAAVTPTTNTHNSSNLNVKSQQARSRSRRRAVTDAGQTDHNDNDDEEIDENTPASVLLARKNQDSNLLPRSFVPLPQSPKSNSNSNSNPSPTPGPGPAPTSIEQQLTAHSNAQEAKFSNDTNINTSTQRPTANGIAFPFKLGKPVDEKGRNPSTITLTSQVGIVPPRPNGKADAVALESELDHKETEMEMASGSGSGSGLSESDKRSELKIEEECYI
ncbi:hypothetical protein MMC09_005458 [Bachmanniomyces sp. S44760]|nr:hypothetical protein [Bachmanniomyces sp. S44760]